ncbi:MULTISPECIES: bifunctional DNA primase/polymerase [Actinosynnema]|uniref:bifunctional DNA primase/polymerase n=1 Tax=Actinosynnema TaxID=40566 RepID=UPI0020A4EB04|nr:bifunctional DNA primase/polymerase [Actinosynnema pretiosum]MCP2096935.1 Bifunctional DNA primase/polymerase, N-terminal [Actinosynnema pretiosum]
MEWSESWRGAFRIELRAEAVNLAWHGWPVLPGTYPSGDGWLGRDQVEASGPVPVHADWRERIGTRPEQVATWWTGGSYTILLATGHGVDAVEVGAELGKRAAVALRTAGAPAPIVATPDGRWMFLVRSGGVVREDLAARGVVHRARGEHITLPPSPARHGVVHWRVKPQVCGWQLPAPGTVLDAIGSALAVRHEGLVSVES